MRLLLIAGQLTGKRSYEELARHCFGVVGQGALDLCVVIMNLGSLGEGEPCLGTTSSTTSLPTPCPRRRRRCCCACPPPRQRLGARASPSLP